MSFREVDTASFPPPTSLPCPWWCTRPAGHPFDALASDAVSRLHELAVADLRFTPGTSAAVDLLQVEIARTDNGPALRSEGIVVSLDTSPVPNLTGPQARQLAAALLNAADEWDRLVTP